MTKSELRKTYIAKKKSLTTEERKSLSSRIFDNFFSEFDLSDVRYLHCFITIEKLGEVDTMQMFSRLWKEFPQIVTAVPRVDPKSGEILSLKFSPETELVRNPWGIHEPAHDEFIDAGMIDIVLTPGLVFDRTGHRVGYGKGYYDRFFTQCRPDCRKVGLSFFPPIDEIKGIHEGDVRLDHIITPELVFQIES